MRDPRVIGFLCNPELTIDNKADLQDKANAEKLFKLMQDAKVPGVKLTQDEVHSAWIVSFLDPTNVEREVSVEFVASPDFRRMRASARNLAKFNLPPYSAAKGERKETKENWADLLAYLREEGMRETQVTRYKGLGEMMAEQLWETTMDPERRTLLKVELQDLVEADNIFSTLMGDDVENRRRFIEENALDVRNLDV